MEGNNPYYEEWKKTATYSKKFYDVNIITLGYITSIETIRGRGF